MKIRLENNFITDNSAECEAGCFFMRTDANAKFQPEAAQKGAQIISVAQAKELLRIDPHIKIIGITGTNGKTTTAAAIYSALLDLGFKCGLSGTRGAFINDERIDEKGLTTSSVFKTMSYLYEASKQGCEYFVMEVSSHAIAQNRTQGLKFALKIFTNLSQDHLDYHGSMQEYAAVKSSFFADDAPKLMNADDGHIKFNPANTLTYGIKNPASFGVSGYGLKGGIDALIRTAHGTAQLQSELGGGGGGGGLLAAFGAIKILTAASDDRIAAALSDFGGVEGRVQVVNKNPLVIVDFAHTPDGIEKVLNALKDHELIVVFGAGGDRDCSKRPKMGAIAEHFAKFCIVTSDNPRSEEPSEIIEQICAGMRRKDKILKIADRKEAIARALDMAQNGEAVVILGKGDETYQEIKGVKHPFSDKQVVSELVTACKNLKDKNDDRNA